MSATSFQTVLVTGASNQIGHFLLAKLANSPHSVHAISRFSHPPAQHYRWHRCNLRVEPLPLMSPAILFHLAPLPLLPNLLKRNNNIKRIIAFSSTSRLSKLDSPDAQERQIAEQLAVAEAEVVDICRQNDTPCTIFRPTLIYGCGRDKNITFIAKFIKKFGFFPLFGAGEGLRQPVHAEDLAIACLQVVDNVKTYYQIYNLTGKNSLSYRQMVVTIFQYLGKKPRFVHIPPKLLPLVSYVRYLPYFYSVSPTMLARMNQDLCFDCQQAQQDFSYQPRGFSQCDLGIL